MRVWAVAQALVEAQALVLAEEPVEVGVGAVFCRMVSELVEEPFSGVGVEGEERLAVVCILVGAEVGVVLVFWELQVEF